MSPGPGPREGVLCVQPGAGLGVEVDPDKLARYRTDPAPPSHQ